MAVETHISSQLFLFLLLWIFSRSYEGPKGSTDGSTSLTRLEIFAGSWEFFNWRSEA